MSTIARITSPDQITTIQQDAIAAIKAAGPRPVYREAGDLGISGATLTALVRRGLVETSKAASRQHGWDVAAYRLTFYGMGIARMIGTRRAAN